MFQADRTGGLRPPSSLDSRFMLDMSFPDVHLSILMYVHTGWTKENRAIVEACLEVILCSKKFFSWLT